MKHILFVLLLLSLATLGFAQNVGIGTATPDASAKVDIQSTNSGILIPRMTTAQRTAIATPATGLLVFDNTTSSFWYYDGTAWIELISDTSLELVDADGDTKVQVEESPDEDIIRFDLAGTEHFVMDGPLLGVKNSGNSVFIGNNAGVNDDRVNNYNVFIGNSAGESNTGGSLNTFIGYAAGKNNVTGIKSTALGNNALPDNNAEGNTAVGYYSLFQNTSGLNNTGMGKTAGFGNISGNGNVFVGTSSGESNTVGHYNTFIGFNADASANNLSNAAAIGYRAFVSQSNSLVLGSISGVNGATGTVKVGIGTTAPGERLHVEGGIRIGNTSTTVAGNIRWTGSDFEGYDGGAWRSFTADQSILEDADGDTKIQVEESPDEDIIRFDLAGTEHFVMDGPHLEVFNSGESVFIGQGAGANDDLSPSNRNTFIGYVAGQQNTTGIYNTFVGNAAGQNNVTGFFNTFLGDRSGVSHTAGDFNTFVGTRSGQFNDVGQHNTFIGATAGSNNTTGNYNTAVGKFTGTANTTGTENTFIGSGANASTNNLTNATALGANTTVSASNSMVLGNNVNVGIGVSTPLTKLHIEDSGPTIIRISSTTSSEGIQFLSPGAGSGALTDWSLISGGSSLQLGYSYDDFSGSLVHAYFYDNGDARIGATGSVGIGIYPQEKLHVDGGMRIGTTTNMVAGNIRWTGSDFEGYDGTAWRSFTADQTILEDADGDTKVQAEESPDEDIIRFDLAGTEHFVMDGPRLEVLNNGESVFIGEGAGGNDDLSANQNVFIGASSGAANTTGNANNFLGFESGTSNTTGWANTFLGFYSGQTNSTGHDNTFIGASAGRFNTIGHSNAFIGNGAGYNNVDGNFNTYMGRDVGLANATGNNNTFVGYRAGYSATVGNNNFFGYQAGLNTTTGVSNTFLGNVSGRANTTGHDNAFVGSASGYNNTTGHSSVFIGPGAGYQNQTGNFNVYIGRDAGLNGTTGTGNVFIGYQAGMNEAGNDKLYIDNSNTTSPLIYGDFNSDIAAINGNLGVGDITPAATLTVGNGDKFQVDGANGDVLFTDDQASITFPAATASATPMIQMFASGTANPDRMVLAHSSSFTSYGLQYQDAGDQFHFLSGGSPVMTVDLGPSRSVGICQPSPTYDLHLGQNSAAKPTSNAWTVPSDARLKKDVHNFEDGLAEILKIRPVTYTYTGEAGLPQDTGVGIIAQELKEVAPYMVSTWTYEGEEADRQEYYAVDNGAMTYMLINAIQEQQKLIEQLQQQVQVLSNGR